MAVPGVDFVVQSTPVAPGHHLDEVVFVVGTPGTNGAIALDPDEPLFYGNTVSDLANAVGDDGPTHEFFEALLDQASPEVVYSPVLATPIGTITARVIAAIDLALNSSPKPTVMHVAGDLTAPGNTTVASPIITELQTICEKLGCRAVANSAQDTPANAIAWGAMNGKPRVMGVFNRDREAAATFEYPAGYWLGGALAISAQFGRAWGINYAPVLGITALEHFLTPLSSELTRLDPVGVSSIVNDEGQFEIIGDEFNATTPADPQSFWTIGRIVDHVERVITEHAHEFIGSTLSADRIAIQLTHALNPVVDAGELVSATIVPDITREQGSQKYFIATLELLFPTNNIHITLRFIV